MRSVWLLGLISLFSCGCIRTAVVQFWEPATFDVTSLNQVVVMEFSGDHGSAVSTVLSSELRQNEFYTVIDRAQLSRELQLAGYVKGTGSAENLHEVLTRAKAQGIDGVLIGDVLEYRVEDQHVRRAAVAAGGSAPLQMNRGLVGAGVGMDLRETLVREGTVTIAFRLVDVETGEVRASRQISHHFKGESEGPAAKLPTQTEILNDLTQKCVKDIVRMLAPHQVTSEIQLASGDFWTYRRRNIKSGNQQAELGNWAAAEEEWQAVVDSDPNNHAALFNLSIAADHRGDYAKAEELAMAALRLQHKTCYTEGLDKIRSHRSAAEKSEEQRDARVATVIDGIWR